jgi:hypothetical protein
MKSFALLVSLGLMGPAGTVVTFDSGPVGRVPAGWTFATANGGVPAQWRILQDGSAPTLPYVLAQTSTGPANRCPLALLDNVTLMDGDVSVRIKPVSGKEDRAGGVVWRYIDPGNYYLARVDSLTHNVVVYKVRDGLRTRVSTVAQHLIPANAWSILKVSARGDRFQVYLDHRRILQGYDRTFGKAGKVGLWTVADSVTYFDDFRVYPK